MGYSTALMWFVLLDLPLDVQLGGSGEVPSFTMTSHLYNHYQCIIFRATREKKYRYTRDTYLNILSPFLSS